MGNDRRLTLLLILLIILMVCAIALVYENRARDIDTTVGVDSDKNYNKNEKKHGGKSVESNATGDDLLQNWEGRWMPSRPGEYTPPPKIFHKENKSVGVHRKHTVDEDSLKNWKGRWMPSRPGEYTPPPKIFHKENKNVGVHRKHTIDEDSLKNWEGRWMPSRPGEYTPPPKILHKINKTVVHQKEVVDKDSLKNWKGRWMPSRPQEYTPPPKIFHTKNTTGHSSVLKNHTRYINLGKGYLCDDGINNLEVDWDHSLLSYTCFGKKIVPDSSTVPEYYCETIPKNYKAMHRCMSEVIEYVEGIPTFGTSRPVWPAYGEYKYLPVQRWLHSLEHGAIVMLYHPCANPLEVERLKRLIKRCLKRHVITPNNFLDEKRPLALLSWGCKLTMSYVDEKLVKQFIHDNALHGAEDRFEDGNYVDQLIEKAKLVSGVEDRNLCPEAIPNRM